MAHAILTPETLGSCVGRQGLFLGWGPGAEGYLAPVGGLYIRRLTTQGSGGDFLSYWSHELPSERRICVIEISHHVQGSERAIGNLSSTGLWGSGD